MEVAKEVKPEEANGMEWGYGWVGHSREFKFNTKRDGKP